MTKLLALFIISIILIVSPVLGDSPDILKVCNQTPGIGSFGKLLGDNKDILKLYASQKDSTLYIPSDKALEEYNTKSSIHGQDGASDSVKDAYQISKERTSISDLRSPPRRVQATADGKNVVVPVNTASDHATKRGLQVTNTTQPPGITIFTGAGETAEILFGDIECIQGLVQVVDTVFTVPMPVTKTLAYTNRTKFLNSIKAANLGGRYDNMSQITVFAPTDSAFMNKTLCATDIGYHVINDIALYTPLLVDGAVYKTSEGSNLYVTVVNNNFYINCVRIVQTDVLTNNGVIFAIDSVLTPLSAPPVCGTTNPNSTGPVQFTGSAPVGKAVSMMVIIGNIFAMVGLAI